LYVTVTICVYEFVVVFAQEVGNALGHVGISLGIRRRRRKKREKRKASREYSAILTKRTYVKQIKYNRRHDSQVPEKKEKK